MSEDNTARPRRIFAVILIVLLLCLIAIGALVWWQLRNRPGKTYQNTPSTTHTPETTPTPYTEEFPNANRFYAYAGIPKPTTFPYSITVLTNKAFLVGYCEKKRNPIWGCYRLFKVANLQAPERPKAFKTDSRTRSGVKSSDYTSSGYDRGHLAGPNYGIAICFGKEAQEETFYMTGITPQRPKMNRDIFENMERLEIRDYAQRFETIWIIAGTIFDENIEALKSGVEIPDACFHVVLDECDGKPRALAFLIPQNVTGKENLSTFLTSVDEIERLSGLELLSDLPDDIEEKLEREKSAMW